jgi:hypothetical protein
MMAKKDYYLIADVIHGELDWLRGQPAIADKEPQELRLRSLTYRMADALARQNPAFKRALFIQECGFPLPLRS